MNNFDLTNFNSLSSLMLGNPIGLVVSLLLIVMSIWVWAVIIAKLRTLKRLQAESEEFINQFQAAKSLSEFNKSVMTMPHSPAKEVFTAGFQEMIRIVQAKDKKAVQVSFDTVKRSLGNQKMKEEHSLSQNMSILAISASAAPFIGLFGTVVGVVQAFHDIGSSGATSLAAVAPGISEALFATALGLFVAIPAVIFYNIIINKIRNHLVLLDSFSSDFLNILERHNSYANSA
jgi:biopolymer transport protein TolQ